MRHGSLFSGIGGFDLASEWMGWENIFHCEWNEFGKQVLKHYWPKSIRYDDITKTDFNIHRGRIDIPCQPYSQAGKRLGKEDDRHLWPEMLRAIREIKPKYVVGENVRGLVNWNGGVVFDEVQTDLEDEGYEVQPFLLPASGVNAPHERYRVWFVAYSNNTGTDNRLRDNGNGKEENKGREEQSQPKPREGSRNVTNSKRGSVKGKCECRQGKGKPRRCGCKDNVANSNGTRQPGKEHREKKPRRSKKKSVPNNWKNFPIESPICDGNDGIPTELDNITFPKWRNESIKAGGNAVVPQLVYQIFKAIEMNEINYQDIKL